MYVPKNNRIAILATLALFAIVISGCRKDSHKSITLTIWSSPTHLEEKNFLEICKKFEASGEEIRLSEKDIPNMTVIDGDNIFINTEDKWIPRQSQADIIMRRSNFAKYMQDLFDYYWNDSLTIEEYEIKIEENNTIAV